MYTPEELERIRRRPFIRRVLAEGKVIYENGPTRYPNSLPTGIPADIYTQRAVEKAVGLAGEVVEQVAALLDAV